jgi:uncharacterized membrane protein
MWKIHSNTFLSSSIYIIKSMEINASNVLYLFLRLSPFVIVGYFILQSLFESSTKGLFYLVGLFATLCFTILASQHEFFKKSQTNIACKGATIGNGRISYLPLSQSTLMYSFVYILTIIHKYESWKMNIGTMITFPVLILVDWYGNRDCITVFPNLLFTLGFAGLIAFMWTNILLSTGHDITFFQGISDANVCKMNTSKFSCRIKK